MKKIFMLLMVLFSAAAVYAQKNEPKKVFFAVTNDGKNIEPIAYIENGEFKEITNEGTDVNANFVKTFYKPKTKYNLIFGGANAGTVSVVKDLSETECATNQANISVASKTVKPKGFVMALATNAAPKKGANGMRKLPTAAERAEIEKLVMAEMLKENIPIKKVNELRYHNLTRIDVDNDKNPEFVGTFWYNTGDKIRSLMFFIADKAADGSFSIAYKDFNRVEESDVMSGNIKDIDEGIYHELLIDMFDVDGNGTAEIFTMQKAFEASNFNAYKKVDGVWTQVLETSNYHCGY